MINLRICCFLFRCCREEGWSPPPNPKGVQKRTPSLPVSSFLSRRERGRARLRAHLHPLHHRHPLLPVQASLSPVRRNKRATLRPCESNWRLRTNRLTASRGLFLVESTCWHLQTDPDKSSGPIRCFYFAQQQQQNKLLLNPVYLFMNNPEQA